MSHKIVHIELSAADQTVAARFYSEVFGWQITPIPEMNYTTFMPAAEPAVGGGFSQVDEHTPAGRVLVYIETDDIEKSFAKIEANGGKRMEPPMEIPGVGAIATFLDPTGNLVALIKPAEGM